MTNALAFATATTRSPGSATETCQFASERAPLSTIQISPSKSPGLAGAGTGWPEAAGPGWAAAGWPAASAAGWPTASAAGWPTASAAGTGRAAADRWEAEVVHRAGDGGPEGGPEAGYRVTVAGTRLAPALLSCGDTEPKAEVRYEAIAFTRIR